MSSDQNRSKGQERQLAIIAKWKRGAQEFFPERKNKYEKQQEMTEIY